MKHLKPRGWCSVIYYRARRIIVQPASTEKRCIMGSPLGEEVWCPRKSLPGALWCRHHARQLGL